MIITFSRLNGTNVTAIHHDDDDNSNNNNNDNVSSESSQRMIISLPNNKPKWTLIPAPNPHRSIHAQPQKPVPVTRFGFRGLFNARPPSVTCRQGKNDVLKIF